MPNISSSLSTTQTYIPAVNATQIGKFAGLHMIFPTFAAFTAAVTAERTNISASSPLWSNRQTFAVVSESSHVFRVWDATAQHGRTVVLRAGYEVVLAADANVVLTTSGAPTSGTGANGDIAIDFAANSLYTKSAGAWALTTGALYASGATTINALTDKATIDLVTINTPLANALAAKASAAALTSLTNTVNALSVTAGGLITTTFAPAIPLDMPQGREMGLYVMSGDVTLTPATGGVLNGNANFSIQFGTGTLTYSAFKFMGPDTPGSTGTYDFTAYLRNIGTKPYLYCNAAEVLPVPPAQVVGLSLTGASLTWTATAGAVSYIVERSADGSTGWASAGTPSTNAFTVTTTGYYRVSAVNANGTGTASTVSTLYTLPVPGQVVGLALSGTSLTWTATATAASYVVERSSDGSTGWTSVGTPSTNAYAVSATGYYRVKAVNATGTGTASVASTLYTAPSIPGQVVGLAAGTITSTTVQLNWTATSGATSYIVEKSTDGGTTFTSAATPSTNTATITGLPSAPATALQWRIKAVNVAGTGTASSVLTANTSAAAGIQLGVPYNAGLDMTVRRTLSFDIITDGVGTGYLVVALFGANSNASSALGFGLNPNGGLDAIAIPYQYGGASPAGVVPTGSSVRLSLIVDPHPGGNGHWDFLYKVGNGAETYNRGDWDAKVIGDLSTYVSLSIDPSATGTFITNITYV